MRRTALALAALATAGVTAACSTTASSTATTTTGTETLYGATTGAAAAANLNTNSNAPLTFPAFTYGGVVAMMVKPFALPSGAPTATDTLPGGLRVHHVSGLPASQSSGNAPPPATWTLKGTECHFVATFDKGTYTVVSGSTGKFAGATGHGTYDITVTGQAPLVKGKTCGFGSTGPVSANGASIVFRGGGPLTVK